MALFPLCSIPAVVSGYFYSVIMGYKTLQLAAKMLRAVMQGCVVHMLDFF